jgi:hypothetical protein
MHATDMLGILQLVRVCLNGYTYLLLFAGLPYELPSVTVAPVDADAAAAGTPAQQHAMVLATGSFSAGRCASRTKGRAACKHIRMVQVK